MGKQKNYTNYTQNPTQTLHSLCISLILRALRSVGFEAKFLHKPCMEPYMGTKSQRVKETKRQRGGAYPNPSLKGRALLRRWCTAHGGLFWGSQRDKERKSGREEGKEKLGEGKEKLWEG